MTSERVAQERGKPGQTMFEDLARTGVGEVGEEGLYRFPVCKIMAEAMSGVGKALVSSCHVIGNVDPGMAKLCVAFPKAYKTSLASCLATREI